VTPPRKPALRLALCLALGGCAAGVGDVPPPETAAQAALEPAVVFDFDGTPLGALPEGWRVGATRASGPLARWAVVAAADAPTPPNALALTAPPSAGAGFNLCWTDAVRFGDGALELAFRADRGAEDQGGGPIWRVQGEDDYYLCRMNPLESNFRVYCVKGGERRQLASAEVAAARGSWHRIRVEHAGAHIVCTLDGTTRLEVSDTTLPQAGGVGLWTKADAATSFDSLSVRVQSPR